MEVESGYQQLCTEFYDITKPLAGPKEVAFYDGLLMERTGPFLEAMCGSGRLLIPLLKKGYGIDGVDNSVPMLESCLRRLKAENLTANLTNQPMQQLSLTKKYDVIFIAVGSFQLIGNREQAFLVLKKLHDHLLPGGMLLIDTFIPWDCIQPAIKGECFLSPKPYRVFCEKSCSSENIEIHVFETITVYPHDQITAIESRYEKKIDRVLVATETDNLEIRWYYRYEMELFLNQAGFSSVEVYDIALEDNPQAVIYQATK